MPSSGYTAITFVANEQPTTAKWNLIGSNDSSFNTGDGFNDAIIKTRHLGSSSDLKVPAGNLDYNTIRKSIYSGTSGTTGTVVTSDPMTNYKELIITSNLTGTPIGESRIINPVVGGVYDVFSFDSAGSVITFYGLKVTITSSTVLTLGSGTSIALNSGGVAGISAVNQQRILSIDGIV